MKLQGRFELKTGKLVMENEGVQEFHESEFDIAAADTMQKEFCTDLSEQWKEKKNHFYNDRDEMFLVTFREGKAFHAAADMSSYNLDFYYTIHDGVLYYSTDLLELLKESRIPRNLNLRGAGIFLANGFILGRETLVENVFKLEFGKELVADETGVRQEPYPYTIDETLKESDLKPIYADFIRESIDRHINSDGDIFIPLSAGYDSNFILDAIQRKTDRMVHAFTVGSKEGTNEIDRVSKNISFLSHVQHHTALVTKETFQAYPDIIRRLQGSCYESGIFLQYVMARLAAEAGAKSMVCGESADEVQKETYIPNMHDVLNGKIIPEDQSYAYCNPFINTNLLVLKKSSLMLDSFGIIGEYPFKDKRIVSAGYAMRHLNGLKKKYFKECCRRDLNPEVMANIIKSGGTTELWSVIDAEGIDRLRSLIGTLPIWEAINDSTEIRVTDRVRKAKADHDRKRWIKKHILHENLPDLDETPVRQLYILLFEELFLSGKYDMQKEAPFTTEEFLRTEGNQE